MRRWSSVNCAGVTEVVGFGFVIIFFNVMQHIAEDMTDPYSNDATDYHLDFDLINLWDESKETIENMVAGGNDLAAKMIQASAKAHSPGEPIRAAVRRQPGAADAKKRSAVGQLL